MKDPDHEAHRTGRSGYYLSITKSVNLKHERKKRPRRLCAYTQSDPSIHMVHCHLKRCRGDRSVLLNLYRSLVRSKLDYGSVVYGSARKSYLKSLNTIHHQGLRLALGAFRTSPVESLYAESNEPSLYTRREKLSLQYTTKLAANPKSPAHNCVLARNTKDFIIIHLRLLSLSV